MYVLSSLDSPRVTCLMQCNEIIVKVCDWIGRVSPLPCCNALTWRPCMPAFITVKSEICCLLPSLAFKTSILVQEISLPAGTSFFSSSLWSIAYLPPPSALACHSSTQNWLLYNSKILERPCLGQVIADTWCSITGRAPLPCLFQAQLHSWYELSLLQSHDVIASADHKANIPYR